LIAERDVGRPELLRTTGEPWIINEVMQAKGSRPDRYPLNQNNAFVINVPMAYSFYLAPVFFPKVVWLGLAPVVFGFGQFLGHGIANNRTLRSWASGISARFTSAYGIGCSLRFTWRCSSLWGC
jgi:hypothetical protein